MRHATKLLALAALAGALIIGSKLGTIGAEAPPASQPATQAATQPVEPGPGLVTLFKNLKAGKKQTVVTWGTSLTALSHHWVDEMGKYMEKEYPGQVTVINSAISGSCSKNDGLPKLKDAVLDKKPDVVFIEFAINDAYLPYDTSLDACRKNTNEMIDRMLKDYPNCQVILQTMNPCFGPASKDRPEVAKYYQVYRDIAKERKLSLIDNYAVWQALVEKDRKLFDKYVPDQLHPAEEGSVKVTWADIHAAFEAARKVVADQTVKKN